MVTTLVSRSGNGSVIELGRGSGIYRNTGMYLAAMNTPSPAPL